MPNLLTTTVPYSLQTFNVTNAILLAKQKIALRFTEKKHTDRDGRPKYSAKPARSQIFSATNMTMP